MSSASNPRRRPSLHITLQRAARLHRLVSFLAQSPRIRADILSHLRIGLRTFYRELELLKRCGVRVRYRTKLYHLLATAGEAEGRLPFPDPQLSFAEMGELALCDCPAGRRLAELLASVVQPAEPPRKARRGGANKGEAARAGKIARKERKSESNP
jgi:predicted DNA-binding transcriptional regulator YafY